MDVNGTRFHLLLGKHDWQGALQVAAAGGPDRELGEGAFWDGDSGTIGLKPLLFLFPAAPGSDAPEIMDRSGAARDRYGNWYWIESDGAEPEGGGVEIRFLFADGGQARHYWSSTDAVECAPAAGDDLFATVPEDVPPPAAPIRMRGLVVTDDHYLVVGTLEPQGLLFFDLHAGGTPIRIDWPVPEPFYPFDMAPTPGGGFSILDRPIDLSMPGARARFWQVDRYFRLVSLGTVTPPAPVVPDFAPDGEVPSPPDPGTPVGPEMAITLALVDPVSIESLPDGSVLFLSHGAAAASAVSRYVAGRGIAPVADLAGALDGLVSADHPVVLRGYDFAFVQSTTDAGLVGTLYIVTSDGNQSVAFRYDVDAGTLTIVLEYFPMRRFGGKALVSAGGAAYYDLDDTWLPLASQPRSRYVDQGVILSPLFDGVLPGCVWHRLFLDALIPPGTSVMVESRSADDADLLAQLPWSAEPKLYLRGNGAEIPYYQPFSEEAMKREGTGTWELLFQDAVGRYAQLRLTLVGSGRSTPRIQALRAYYPRFSYLSHYLPALYRDDESSAAFLDRFLANVEGFYTAIEGRIEQAQMLFDVRTVAGPYMDWLAGWLGVMLEADWSASKRRLFIAHAIELFNGRGTPRGVIRAIRFAIDPAPDESMFSTSSCGCSDAGCRCGMASGGGCFEVRIVERFLTRNLAGVLVGDPTELEGPGLAPQASTWEPAAGVHALHAAYRSFLKGRYAAGGASEDSPQLLNNAWGTSYASYEDIFFSPVTPSNSRAVPDWRAFASTAFAFEYADVLPADLGAYQLFLARRYNDVALLNSTYGFTGAAARSSFQTVTLPAESDMPSGGARLVDWLQFVSLVLPIAREAHRFTVLVPVDTSADDAEQERLMGLVQRVVDLEKPAHTWFEVKQYWALFRVGEARLAYDTLLDKGSRFTALLLGKRHLAESYLGARYPWDIPDRMIAGRDQVPSDRNCDRPDL